MSKVRKAKKPAQALPDARKSELTRLRILDAAAKVFAERGYAHTRLTDIAQEAQSHAGGIYYYFESREALVDEVLRISTQRSIDQLKEALAALRPNATAADRLLAASKVQLSGVMGDDPYHIAHQRIYHELPEDIRARHTPLLHEYFGIWRRIILDGQKSGEFRKDIDPSVLRMTISGAIQWTNEWASTTRGSPEALATKMVGIFLHGALARA